MIRLEEKVWEMMMKVYNSTGIEPCRHWWQGKSNKESGLG